MRRWFALLMLVLLCSVFSVPVRGEDAPVLALDPAEVTLHRGKTARLQPHLSDASLKARYAWETSDKAVATVSGGTVTARGAGKARITCSATLPGGDVLTAVCAVTVVEPIRSVKLSGRDTMLEGDTQALAAVIAPDNASITTLDWSSSNPAVAAVDGTGLVTALGEGRARITARATDGSGREAEFALLVKHRITPVRVVSFDAGEEHVLGLRPDGTVVADGSNEYGQCEVSDWTDIVSVSAGMYYSLGLRADGTVVSTAQRHKMNRDIDVSGWTGVVAIAAGSQHAVGLLEDGTVVAAGNSDEGQCNVWDWTDIVDIACGSWHTLGLRADGTVVACGTNDYGQCDVQGWKDVAEMDGGHWFSAAVTTTGRVLVAGGWDADDRRILKLTAEWSDVVGLYCAGSTAVYGIRQDGTVLTLNSYDKKNEKGAARVRTDWNSKNALLGQDGVVVSKDYPGINGQQLQLPVHRLQALEAAQARDQGIWLIRAYSNAPDEYFVVNSLPFEGTFSRGTARNAPSRPTSSPCAAPTTASPTAWPGFSRASTSACSRTESSSPTRGARPPGSTASA